MNTTRLSAVLDQTLTDQQILDDLSRLLLDGAQDGVTSIELDSGWEPIPVDAPLEIVTKAFFKEYHPGVGFGTFKVLVAIGEFERVPTGLHRARYCFAMLFYDDECQLITNDFHHEFR